MSSLRFTTPVLVTTGLGLTLILLAMLSSARLPAEAELNLGLLGIAVVAAAQAEASDDIYLSNHAWPLLGVVFWAFFAPMMMDFDSDLAGQQLHLLAGFAIMLAALARLLVPALQSLGTDRRLPPASS